MRFNNYSKHWLCAEYFVWFFLSAISVEHRLQFWRGIVVRDNKLCIISDWLNYITITSMVDVWEYGVHQSEENVKNVSARVSSSCKWTRKNSGVDDHIYSYVCIINYYYDFDFDSVSCAGLLAQTSYNKDEPLCLFLIPQEAYRDTLHI